MKISVLYRAIGLILCLLCGAQGFGQQKKILDHSDFAIWNEIQRSRITSDGNWISYELVPGEGDPTLVVYNVMDGSERRYPRSHDARFTDDNNYVIFTQSPAVDSLKALRRIKTDKEKLPTDTLAILTLASGRLIKIPDLHSVKTPDRWSGYVVYQTQPAVKADVKKDASSKEEKSIEDEKKPKEKSASEKNGYPLIVRNLQTSREDTLPFVKSYVLSKYGGAVAAYSSGIDSLMDEGMYVFSMNTPSWRSIMADKGKYDQLTWNESGDQLAFIADIDTTRARIRPFQLYQWKPGQDTAALLVKAHAPFMSQDWMLSEHYDLKFSKDGTKLHFGIAPPPILEDTTLLDEEIVNVEVWTYRDERVYTQENVRAKSERERAYQCVADLKSGLFRQVANEHLKDTRMDPDGNSPVILLKDNAPYLRESSWTGETHADIWTYQIQSGQHKLLATNVDENAQLSPEFNYVFWYNAPDSAWFVTGIQGKPVNVSDNLPTRVYDELNDVPANPESYGAAGWTTGDSALLIYDRYDIWQVDPKNLVAPVNLTNGREYTWKYRYIRLDPDARNIDPSKPMMLYVFNETTKESGYATLDLRTRKVKFLVTDNLRFDPSPLKARDVNTIVFTAESFKIFPDLQVTRDDFGSYTRVSFANPQQGEYAWGTIELFDWTAFDGKQLQGLLVKPANFDPDKKYPLIVNFYERSTDGLYQHRAPYPHRSTINYAFYASRGYVIFNPDVVYGTGHPGDDAFNCVVSGTQELMKEGFIDPQRMALQGHSWGGYQVAYILTKTGIYKCAEAGAVVVNMTSAYGGIRWETGLSRMFQYEHQQSRIGGSLWEKRDDYIASSPLFELDKVSTPVLILQNDADGHVPWYQGIEFFVAMRRLGKPAWLLNYNGEPHWPVKLQNRKDFTIRVQQFFDYYLKDAPMPKWMRDGVAPVEKGIDQGYELIERPAGKQ